MWMDTCTNNLDTVRLTHANIWESMGKPCSWTQFVKGRIFYYKSLENPYQYHKSHKKSYEVLQVTCVRLNVQQIEGSYDKIIMTLAPSYT